MKVGNGGKSIKIEVAEDQDEDEVKGDEVSGLDEEYDLDEDTLGV
jgi:hypothetical protein